MKVSSPDPGAGSGDETNLQVEMLVWAWSKRGRTGYGRRRNSQHTRTKQVSENCELSLNFLGGHENMESLQRANSTRRLDKQSLKEFQISPVFTKCLRCLGTNFYTRGVKTQILSEGS